MSGTKAASKLRFQNAQHEGRRERCSERLWHEEQQHRARSLEGHRRPQGKRFLPTVELRRNAGAQWDGKVVTSRTTQAVNYKHRGGATKVDFAGTELMPSADGRAE